MTASTGPVAHYRERDGGIQTVPEHLFGVAELASIFAGKIGCEGVGELIGLLHDLGKYSKAFQDYLQTAVGLTDPDGDDFVDVVALKGKVDHSTAGAQFVWQELSKRGGADEVLAQIMSLCIASHHSGLIDCVGGSADNFGQDVFGRRMSKSSDKTHLEEVLKSVDPEVLQRAHELLSDKHLTGPLLGVIQSIFAQNKLTGTASATGHVSLQQVAMLVRLLFSCLIDADRIDTADFERKRNRKHRPLGDYVPWDVLVDRLEGRLQQWLPSKPIDKLRQDISQHCLDAADKKQGTYTLTVPTGGGKTLASLRFALHHAKHHELDRVIYVIPFTSIIDQNAAIVRGILESDPEDQDRIVLEHHSNLTREQQGWRDKMLCENWDAPVVYTTMVQFLDTLFGSGTRGARRMHQLVNTVLVFDEIQTLPIRCVHLFNNAINFLVDQCGCTVVLCTATQPLLHSVSPEKGAARLLPDHEIMPSVANLFDQLNRVEVRNLVRAEKWTSSEVAALAIESVSDAGSALVIVNTKEAAKRIFLQCQAHASCPVFHLSTSMCPAHRKQVLSAIRSQLAASQPLICVSTQLIEAGVDVDFGAVIRSLAGLDSIAQAAGRCNRNGLRHKGIVSIINSADENIDELPDIKVGSDKAQRTLDDFARDPNAYGGNSIGPQLMTWYYENYFYGQKDKMDYPVDREQVGHEDSVLRLCSTNDLAFGECWRQNPGQPVTRRLLRQAFMTAGKAFKAIDAPTQGVIVPYGEEGKNLVADLYAAYDINVQFDLLKRAQQFTVNVFPHIFKKLQEAGALHEVKPNTSIYSVDARYYSQEFGLTPEISSDMEVMYA